MDYFQMNVWSQVERNSDATTKKKLYGVVGNPIVFPVEQLPEGAKVTSVIWKHKRDKAAEWCDGDEEPTYFGIFKSTSTLDMRTGALTISNLQPDMLGKYSVTMNMSLNLTNMSVTLMTVRLKELPPMITDDCWILLKQELLIAEKKWKKCWPFTAWETHSLIPKSLATADPSTKSCNVKCTHKALRQALREVFEKGSDSNSEEEWTAIVKNFLEEWPYGKHMCPDPHIEW